MEKYKKQNKKKQLDKIFFTKKSFQVNTGKLT